MQKSGVNGPCWCGSGRKLKKCHGRESAPPGTESRAAKNVVAASKPSAAPIVVEPATNGYSPSRTIPEAVMRQLRQEAGFGCAKCGHPYIEYHHIIPFAEEGHHRPEDMMAACGNCHPEMAKLGRDRQRAFKEKPFNQRSGLFRGALVFDKRDLVFRLGGNWYENTPILLQYNDTPIVSCRLDDDQAKVSLNLLSPQGQSLLRVIDNEVSFRINDLWDFEYGHNFAIARYARRDIALRMDLRGQEATIEGKLWMGGSQVRLDRESTSLPGGKVSNCRFSGCHVGIQVG